MNGIALNEDIERIFDVISNQNYNNTINDENKINSDDILQSINFIINDDKLLDSAVDIIDRMTSKISVIRGSNKDWKIWKILGSNGQYYKCLKTFCQCRSYLELNQSSKSVILCKHLLALRIANCLNVIDETIVTDNEYAQLISSLYVIM